MEIPPSPRRAPKRDVRRAIIAGGCVRHDGIGDGVGVGAVARWGEQADHRGGGGGGGGEGARRTHGARAARRGRPRSAGIRGLA